MDARKASTAELKAVATVDGQCPFSEDQLQHLKDVFIMFDTDKSGSISRLELDQMVRALGFLHLNSTQVNRIFTEVDTDQSGAISFEEFVSGMARAGHDQVRKYSERELLSAFKIYDANQDGYITPAELKAVMLSTGENLGDDEAQLMIEMADTDHDGRISWDEFVRFLRD